MIRAVLAVMLAVALLATTVPAVERAGIDRTEQTIQNDLEYLDDQALALLNTEEIVDGPGAKRTVSVTIPDGGLVAAETDQIAIKTGELTYQIDGKPEQSILPRAPIVRPENAEPLVMASAGTHTIELEPVWRDEHRKVMVTGIHEEIEGQEGQPPAENETVDLPEEQAGDESDGTDDQESDDQSIWDRIREFIPW